MNRADQYIKTIYVLEEASDAPASTGDIADKLEVSPASANEMIGKLADRDLVEHEKYEGTVVTDEGEQRARTAVESYCVVQRFLHMVLEVDDYKREARSIEPVLDPTVVERLDTLVDRPIECPECFDGALDQCDCLDLPETANAPESVPSPTK